MGNELVPKADTNLPGLGLITFPDVGVQLLHPRGIWQIVDTGL